MVTAWVSTVTKKRQRWSSPSTLNKFAHRKLCNAHVWYWNHVSPSMWLVDFAKISQRLNACKYPGYQRFFSRAAGIFRVGRRPKPRAAKPREKPLARSGAFYRPRWPLSFFIGLHLRQSDWKSPTVIMWAGTWRNVRRPTLSLERQVRV